MSESVPASNTNDGFGDIRCDTKHLARNDAGEIRCPRTDRESPTPFTPDPSRKKEPCVSDSSPYTIITADSHAGASITTYREYLDEKHQALFDEWREGYKNPQRKHIGSKKHKNWDAAERIADMDAEGVAGEVIFPNTVPPFFRTSVLICGNPPAAEYEMRLQGIRAHNRWLVDFCREAPERRAGIGLIYLNDIDHAIEDIEWIARQGLRGGILLPHVPDDCTHILPLYAREYDRVWAACQEHDVVINQHGGTGSPDRAEDESNVGVHIDQLLKFALSQIGADELASEHGVDAE